MMRPLLQELVCQWTVASQHNETIAITAMIRSSDFDTVVVGAGFAGLYMLHRLRGLGHRALVIEKGSGVGGTWYWNRYPGARCDVASMEYSYQFDAELQQEWNWSEKFSPQPEILRYANHVADRFQLRPHIRFDTTVTRTEYDEDANQWKVISKDQNGIETSTRSRYLITATGCLSSPNKPEITGLHRFEGRVLHTGEWPHEEIDFSDKRVAIIGTGSSGVQAIPVIAKQAANLTVLQRTANYAVPARNASMGTKERDEYKANYAELRRRAASTRNGQLTEPNPQSAITVSEDERRKQYELRWQRGGLAFIGSFNDLITNKSSNQTAADFVRNKIFEKVNDSDTARILSPTTLIGCKRLCVDSGYYETFNRPNVSLVDIKANPIDSIDANGLTVGNRFIPLDAIVLATGYDAMTGSLLKLNAIGRNGVALVERWHAGPETYLGIAMHEFPNFFTITGPGSPSVLTNMLPSIEQHVDLLTRILSHADANGHTRIETTLSAQRAWAAHVNETASQTIYPSCNSWYLGANVPGKPRVFMPYVGFPEYVQQCEEMVANNYRGFEFSH